jgi:PIN domain nuclease of toxin-antitoxin system
VRLLLDTHVLIWALEDSTRLSRRARAWLADQSNECWVSAASLWEMAIKARLGKLELASPLAVIERAVIDSGLAPLDVTLSHAAAVERVESAHGDPFDRLLLAQCEIETLRLLTADHRLAGHPVALAA